jgi:hypothetical protein
MANKSKQRAWFASLKNAKLLCWDCKQLKKVSKYILGGRVQLECGHERHCRATRLEEVELKLEGNEKQTLRKYLDLLSQFDEIEEDKQ